MIHNCKDLSKEVNFSHAGRERGIKSCNQTSSRYYRFLGELLKTGTERISSRELAEKMGLTASQIRQDLNCFGGFGQQGYGYNIIELHKEIGHILGLDVKTDAILIGAGNLGRAIANHMPFEERGFSLIGIFDQDPALFGQKVRNIPIQSTDDLETFCKAQHPFRCIPLHTKNSNSTIKRASDPGWNSGFLEL